MADNLGKDILSKDVEIKGSIKFQKELMIDGKVHGNITVGERCELKSRCTLQGDLKAARLVIEDGATFIGKSEVTSGKTSSAPSSNSGSRPDNSRNDDNFVSPKAAMAGRA